MSAANLDVGTDEDDRRWESLGGASTNADMLLVLGA